MVAALAKIIYLKQSLKSAAEIACVYLIQN